MTIVPWLLVGLAGLAVVTGLVAKGRPMPGSREAIASMPASTQARLAGPQPHGIAVVHRAGQTFVTWHEIDPAPKDELTVAQLSTAKREAETKRIRYRVYRSPKQIEKTTDAELVGETPALSGWDAEHFGFYPPADARLPRFVIEDGKSPLPSGTGLFVLNPSKPGSSFYAVTVLVNGSENQAVSNENATSTAVTETIGQGIPVLQRVSTPDVFQYVEKPTLRYYVRWESPPNSSVSGKPFDYLVAVPSNVRSPAQVGIHLHAWGSSMVDGWGWWYNVEHGAVLVAANENPYDWWTGYHEQFWKRPLTTEQDWKQGVVRPYSQTRLFSFVDWLGTIMKLDGSRTFVGGNSMGGSGAIMLAIRHPERIAWAIGWVGVHVPEQSPQFKSSYETVYGRPEWRVPFQDGTPAWDYFNDVWYLRQHPQQDVGFITFSNGKNDSAIGWSQAVEFLKALQETRQPHQFVWGQDGHGQRAVMPGGGGEQTNPLDIRIDQSLPAFTRCSLDDDPGNGTVESGAASGQINRFLTWRTDSIVDEPARWSMVVALLPISPRPTATVDVTPRRLQQFKLHPGDRVVWTNSVGGSVVQRGDAIADKWGLVTLPQVEISRGGNRIALIR
jgi:pimeloyl-ACP methyl ester carboxylesterase